MRRLIDITFASFCLILFSPLIMTIALALRVTSPGRVFEIRSLYGRNKPIQGYRFRIPRRADSTPTLFGHLLRRTSFDELPLLINVLRGELALAELL